MRNLTFLVIFVLVACNGDGPPPPPPPPLDCAVWSAPDNCVCPEGASLAPALGVCAPPRVDRLVDWGAVRGLTAFSISHKSLPDMVDYFYKTHEEGWTMHRAGAQARWPQSCTPPEGLQVVAPQLLAALEHDVMFQLATQGYLPCGPSHGSPEADANLVRMLEVSARIPNTWIQLIPTFTLKHVDKGSSQANVEYFNGVYDHVLMIVSKGNYKHVIWEMFNEVVHPISSHIKDEDVRDMIRHVQATSTLPIGTDYHGGRAGDEWQGRYPNIWRRHVDYIAFHTERNPEPPLSVMRAAQRRYGYVKPVLIDETVSWASDQAIGDYQLRNNGNIAERGYGTEESRMLQCVVHLKNIYQVRQGERRWRPFFHSIWGIHGYHIGQMPNFDRDIIGGQ